MKKGANVDREDLLGHTAAWYAMDAGNSSIKVCLDPTAELNNHTDVERVSSSE